VVLNRECWSNAPALLALATATGDALATAGDVPHATV
jgi:hypothetical protein